MFGGDGEQLCVPTGMERKLTSHRLQVLSKTKHRLSIESVYQATSSRDLASFMLSKYFDCFLRYSLGLSPSLQSQPHSSLCRPPIY